MDGTVTELTWSDSAVYPGTHRRALVHVPAALDPREPAGLVVFQDGSGFLDPDDDLRAGRVLDGLVGRGEIPPTIGVFVDPGEGARNAEYDAFDDSYATFLLEEVVPRVSERWSITDDHDRWGTCGFSSGASCAFTAAWMRPDAFRRVVAFSASFAQLPGGNPYPDLIRASTDHEPLRVHLHVGHRDLGHDEPEDNWLAENLRTAAALAEAGHDLRVVVGDGGHDTHDAGALLPEALRWALRST